MSIEDVSENGSKVDIPVNDEKSNPEDPNSAFEEMTSKYKEFFVTYGDDNIKYFEG